MITGGMVEFRRSLALSFLFRFFVHVASQLEADQPGFQAIFPPTFKSAAVPFHRPPVQGLQYYSKVPGEAVVGQPTRHMAADLQVHPRPPPLLPAFRLCLRLSLFLHRGCACIYPASCLLPVITLVLMLRCGLLLPDKLLSRQHTDGPGDAKQDYRSATVTL